MTDEFITVYGKKHKEKPRPKDSDIHRFSVYIVADEINPFTKKWTRKIIIPPPNFKGSEAEYQRVINPTKYGIFPKDEASKVSIGRHVLGMTNSNFISVSKLPSGSPRFNGQWFWIDKKKVLQSGAKIYDEKAILPDIDRVVEKIKKADKEFKKTGEYTRKTQHYLNQAQELKYLSPHVDQEVLVQGRIPSKAIKDLPSALLTRRLQVVSAFGIVMTVNDIASAAEESIKQKSMRPVTTQVAKEIGGWGGAIAGSRVGFAIGASLGVETGPGALIVGAAGSVIGGAIGYIGVENILKCFNWSF